MGKNYTLILLKDGRNILVNDENIKEKDIVYSGKYKNIVIATKTAIELKEDEELIKIIAGVENLPYLTYSEEVKQILKDKYGWVDLIELGELETNLRIIRKKTPIQLARQYFEGFIEGFKTHQSITNKMFSLEDMINAYKQGCSNNSFGEGYHTLSERVIKKELERTIKEEKEFIQSLQQPIQLKVKLEMEDKGYFGEDKHPTQDNGKWIEILIPKITNNSILITNIV